MSSKTNSGYPTQIENIYQVLKDGIARKRAERGISQSELSEELGMTSSYIGRIERGDQEFTYESFYRIANFFGKSTREFFDDLVLSKPKVVVAKYKSVSGSSRPRQINRYGFSESRDSLTFHSLLDPIHEEQKVISDFQMSIVSFEADEDGSILHYHPGSEIAFILEGEVNFRYLSLLEKKSEWKDLQLYEDKLNFVSFDSSIPHKYQSNVPSRVLTILDDPRGEAGLYKYDLEENTKKVEQIYIYDSQKSKDACIANSFGFRLRHHRLNLGLSVQELANRTSLSSSFLSRLERNETAPPIKSVLNIATFGLDISPRELFSNEPLERLKIELKSLITHIQQSYESNIPEIKSKLIVETRKGLVIKSIYFDKYTRTEFLSEENDVNYFVFSGTLNFHEGTSGLAGKTLSEKNPSSSEIPLGKWDNIYVTKGYCYALEAKSDTLIIKVSKDE